jgi:GH25 family lysozyme M1 (1,4-beta-N-acetylmuramidase)
MIMSKQGIDISYCQTNVDYNKLKASGVEFVIIQAGYGRDVSQKDKMFETHYAGCKAAGIKVGAYWYSYAVSEADAVQEAQACLNAIKGKQFEYPIYYDVEEQSQFNKGKAFCDSITKAFLSRLEASGYYAGLYTGRYAAQNYFSQSTLDRYALWIAEYGGKLNYTGKYGMWQNSSEWVVSGISSGVDHDYCYVDYPKLIKEGGYNGYKKPTPKPAEKVLDKTGYTKGKKTIGVLALKQLIIIAKAKGYIKQGVNNDEVFGNGTEKAVNECLKKWGYKQNGIAGENFIKKLGSELKK